VKFVDSPAVGAASTIAQNQLSERVPYDLYRIDTLRDLETLGRDDLLAPNCI
jgi:hypothetical protein